MIEPEEDESDDEFPVYSFGWNGEGQTHSAEEVNLDSPLLLPLRHFRSCHSITKVSIGRMHALFCELNSGHVFHLGRTATGDTNTTPTKVDTKGEMAVDVEAGFHTSFFISGSRKLYAWGDARQNQLGMIATGHSCSVPRIVDGLANWRISSISAGDHHVLGLTKAGKVYAWGRNDHGQLGLDDTAFRETPVLITFFQGCKVTCVAAGGVHSAAIGETKFARHLDTPGNKPAPTKALFTWGLGSSGQLGHGSTESLCLPTCVQSLLKPSPIKVALGFTHTLILCSNGALYSCGDNTYGQLGMGDNFARNTPTVIPDLGNVKQVSAGYRHNIALCGEAGTPFSWGSNEYGECGLGDFKGRLSAHPIALPKKRALVNVACGYRCSTLVFTTDKLVASLGFKDDSLLHPLLKSTNKSRTVIRNAEEDGYVYIALCGPAVQEGSFKWLVKVNTAMSQESSIGIGVAPASTMKPWIFDPGDVGGAYLYLQTGHTLHSTDRKHYGEPFFEQDDIEVEVDCSTGSLRFARRGQDMGVAYYVTHQEPLYLCISLPGDGDQVTVSAAEPEDDIQGNGDPGLRYCFNFLGVNQTSGIEVFYFCATCKVQICRACSRRCHNTHSTRIIVNHRPKAHACKCTASKRKTAPVNCKSRLTAKAC